MTMDEYINRDAAIAACFDGFADCRDDCAANIRGIPAADVRPVVRAHWIDHRTIEHDGEWYCSNCGNEVTICMCGKDKTPSYPFCPNCGADMREES